MQPNKVCRLSDAIARFVDDGDTVAMGTGLETCIPFAAGHEIIRQGRRELTLVGPISDMLFDQLIGAGCVRRVRAAWVGNVITGSGYNFRRAVEDGRLEVEDHSNLTLAMALHAAAMGVPFMPTYTALGSDLYRSNKSLKAFTCPISQQTLTAVAAIVPDVTIVHVQRADESGNAHLWGNFGVTREACLAARRVIVTCEEVVATERIAADPNRIIVPALRVCAVVPVPWGAYPSPMPGCYNRDHQAFLDYSRASRSEAGYAQWREEWVDGCADHQASLARRTPAYRTKLALTQHAYSEGVDYGY